MSILLTKIRFEHKKDMSIFEKRLCGPDHYGRVHFKILQNNVMEVVCSKNELLNIKTSLEQKEKIYNVDFLSSIHLANSNKIILFFEKSLEMTNLVTYLRSYGNSHTYEPHGINTLILPEELENRCLVYQNANNVLFTIYKSHN